MAASFGKNASSWVTAAGRIANRSTRVTYWDGAVGVSGIFRNNAIMGNGYVEMTGYRALMPAYDRQSPALQR